jgi:MoaD family protein
VKIKVRFYGIAYEKAEVREWSLEIGEESTVRRLLTRIVDKYPLLKDLVYDDNGSIRDYLVFAVNNVNIQGLNGTETILKQGDTVFVMPPIGGG